MTTQEQPVLRAGDFLSNPLAALFWWGLPLAAGWAGDALPIAPVAKTATWSLALAWMGVGCALNARRCHRLHCFISAPVLLLGAIGVALSAAGFTPLGPATASYLINGALALALLSFVAEVFRGKYA
jgi:hypothetical protein